MGEVAGTDIAKIKYEWGEEFRELSFADDWTLLEDKFSHESRWCTHWRKVLKHDTGMLIAIEYAQDTGDGDSASAYEDEWYEVEGREKTIIEYVRKISGDSP